VTFRRWFLRLPQEKRPLVVVALTVATWLVLAIPGAAVLWLLLRN
jgi:hypothetical protein